MNTDAPSEQSDSIVKISTEIYSLEAIKKTAYKFADRVSIAITPDSTDFVVLHFALLKKSISMDITQVIADFNNELLDQDLRQIIKQEVTPLRNLILAHAFSRTTLISEK